MLPVFPPALELAAKESVIGMIQSTQGLKGYKIVQVGPGNNQALNLTIAGFLGFGGEKLKGSLVLISGQELLEKSHPNHALGKSMDIDEIKDWIGEMGNQMLGRLKNKLVTFGVGFSMSTPTALSGKDLKINTPKNGVALRILLNGHYGPMVINFLVIIDPQFEFKASTRKTAKEGDSLIF